MAQEDPENQRSVDLLPGLEAIPDNANLQHI
jgi:hypothetical protein